MSGHHPWSEIRAKAVGQPGAREEIDAIGRALEDVLRLVELRDELHITDEDLDRAFEASFPKNARTEALYFSTMRGYVEALGGTLQISAVFPKGIVSLPVDR
jgi:hypothetical protein